MGKDLFLDLLIGLHDWLMLTIMDFGVARLLTMGCDDDDDDDPN